MNTKAFPNTPPHYQSGMAIKKIISGGQSGADLAGLCVGTLFGLETGGWMPKGFKTLDGNRPQYASIFGVKEHSSWNYRDRTYDNVREADLTIRFANNFGSTGEKCTWNAIKVYNKPSLDIKLPSGVIEKFGKSPVNMAFNARSYIQYFNPSIINIAGNSEQTYNSSFLYTFKYLSLLLINLGYFTGSVVQFIGAKNFQESTNKFKEILLANDSDLLLFIDDLKKVYGLS